MIQPLSIAQLRQLERIMNKMLAEAKIGNWTALTTLDEQRRKLLDFQGGESENTASLSRPDSNKMLAFLCPALYKATDEQAKNSLNNSFEECLANGSLRTDSVTPERRPDNRQLNSQMPMPENHNDEFVHLCHHLRHLDELITNTVYTARQELVEQSRELRTQHKGILSYQQLATNSNTPEQH